MGILETQSKSPLFLNGFYVSIVQSFLISVPTTGPDRPRSRTLESRRRSGEAQDTTHR